jgi:hypothetical protein
MWTPLSYSLSSTPLMSNVPNNPVISFFSTRHISVVDFIETLRHAYYILPLID